MKKRILVCICAAALMVSTLSGCAKKNSMERYAKCADVKDYVGVEYTPESREVTQEQIDEAIDDFCDDNKTVDQNKEKTVEAGDEINIDYVQTISGTENDSQQAHDLTVGDAELGEDFDNGVIGMVPGDSKTISVTYADDYEDTTLAGLTAEYEVTLNYVEITTIPEYNDDLVNTATEGEYTTTADYTQHLTDDLQKEADDEADEADRTAILDAIIEKTTFDKYPENEAQDNVEAILANMESSASNYGIDLATMAMYFYGCSTREDLQDFLKEQVTKMLKEKIVVSSIAIDQKLTANEEEIKAYKQKLADENEVELSEIDEYYSAEDLKYAATEEKVLDYLVENATVVEATETTEEATEAE